MVTVIDDQIVEQLESFEVIISFPSDQPALQSSDIVPPGMQINGMINIIDDDGEWGNHYLCTCAHVYYIYLLFYQRIVHYNI